MPPWPDYQTRFAHAANGVRPSPVIVRATPEDRQQFKIAYEARVRWIVEAVACSRELAEQAMQGCHYDLTTVMYHAMYLQSVHLAKQDSQQVLTDRFTLHADGNCTANQTNPMHEMTIPYIPFVDQYTCEETVCFTDRDLREIFKDETAVHAATPMLGTYMVNTEVCNSITLTCDSWEQHGMMMEENMVTAEQLVTYLGEEMLPTVGAAELPIRQLITEAPAETKEAIDKEIKAMFEIRKRLVRVKEGDFTEQEKKAALELRFTMTRKRPTEDDIRAGKVNGRLKARLVAKDLKCIHQMPEEQTYAPVPELMAFRLLMAAFDSSEDRISTTDFDTAYLQVPPDGTKMRGKYRDPWTGEWIYVMILGIVYGLQIGGAKWLETIRGTLTSEPFNMKELENNKSVYINKEKGITVCQWVDDPIIISKTEEAETWFHTELAKKYDTKGKNMLTASNPIDYLSIRLQLRDDGTLTLDNKAKINVFLQEQGMGQCNISKTPLTKQALHAMHSATEMTMNRTGIKKFQAIIGDGNWLVQTTHPTLATATSILAGYSKAPPETADALLQHYLRYLKRASSFGLVNDPTNRSGYKVQSDSDWAGLYSVTGETRSRSGTLITLHGMPIAWQSQYQKCVGTAHKQGLSEEQTATASGEAELYAAADTLKAALHVSYVAEELNLPMPSPLIMHVDATAAIGKIQGPRGGGKMKHIDLRAEWMNQLRDRKIVNVVKIPGEENGADFFTKLLGRIAFQQEESVLMGRIDDDGT